MRGTGKAGLVCYVVASFQTEKKYSKRDPANKQQLVPRAEALESKERDPRERSADN